MDNLTPEQRSRTMSLIRSKDTQPELTIRRLLHARGLRFRKHAAWLPGQPDIVFVSAKVTVFVDGDYWHGWRFPLWSGKLTAYWKHKIEGTAGVTAEMFDSSAVKDGSSFASGNTRSSATPLPVRTGSRQPFESECGHR